MEMMAQEFPGAFSGYNLSVTESHQRTKADTSGTAKAVVGSLQRLGLDFSEVSLFYLATWTIPLSCLDSWLSIPHGYIAFGHAVTSHSCAHQALVTVAWLMIQIEVSKDQARV